MYAHLQHEDQSHQDNLDRLYHPQTLSCTSRRLFPLRSDTFSSCNTAFEEDQMFGSRHGSITTMQHDQAYGFRKNGATTLLPPMALTNVSTPSARLSDKQLSMRATAQIPEDPFAEWNQMFLNPLNRSLGSPYRDSTTHIQKFNAYHVSPKTTTSEATSSRHSQSPLVSDVYTDTLSIQPGDPPQPSPLPTVIKARHDRQTLYTWRTRWDGSRSFVPVPVPQTLNILQDNPQPRGLQSLNLLLKEMDERDDDDAEEDSETKQGFDLRLTYLIEQMMFVSGETAEPGTETTWMIEEIVREQVVEMLKEALLLANRRGSKSISIVDLIFQIRHNPAKVSRLKTFLSWKDVRKNVKDSDDKAGGADADALDLEDGALPGANPAAPQKTSTNKKAKLTLPWEVQSFYNEIVPEREDEEDEEEEEQNEATLARLASADERTRNMTREEYVYWSDCRQASFTFRKGKRFREWAGFGTIIDSKPNDDVVDILGFLTFEIVQTLTEEALKVKLAEDLANKKASGLRGDIENAKKRKREGCTLFEMPEEDRTPVEPKHVREAFRRLQAIPNKYKYMRQGYAGVRTPLRMI